MCSFVIPIPFCQDSLEGDSRGTESSVDNSAVVIVLNDDTQGPSNAPVAILSPRSCRFIHRFGACLRHRRPWAAAVNRPSALGQDRTLSLEN